MISSHSLSNRFWINTLLSILLACISHTAIANDKIQIPKIIQSIDSTISNKPEYYPQCRKTPLRVGKEDYQKGYLSLRGLKGVYINIDDVLKGAAARNVVLEENLKGLVVKMLNDAGLRLLTKEEMKKTPGQPEMSMYPSFPNHLGPYNEGDERIPYREDCCSIGIWTSFAQGAATLRDPLTNHKLGTWGTGHNTTDCSDVGGWMSKVVKETVEAFVEDKVKAEKEKIEQKEKAQAAGKKILEAKKQETPAESGAMECNTSLMMYIEMFKTNQTHIMPSKYFVLNKLAEAMMSCPTYHYIIETHADPRASHAYNEKLSEKRAASIKRYLMNKGVDENAFEMMAFGESRPVTAGVADEDYAANRRVVVTPIKVQP
ncbi:MAG: Outer membrane protein OmpA [uncultured Thiotrichaceae bacterium]|uniref:Outer membrane protein OmpA n=1 Tax=uncultured Thiotrichaceae bacterium TaxID=298394 RepID=A0A6S6S7R3_9GAMM|nr:MAG: Outer membrane protein OmpA [uncultured Thiotrichaceae bacterium]